MAGAANIASSGGTGGTERRAPPSPLPLPLSSLRDHRRRGSVAVAALQTMGGPPTDKATAGVVNIASGG